MIYNIFFRDGDGILDILDNCPSYPNADQSDIDENGEGRGCCERWGGVWEKERKKDNDGYDCCHQKRALRGFKCSYFLIRRDTEMM